MTRQDGNTPGLSAPLVPCPQVFEVDESELLREAPIGNLEPVGADRVTNAQLESDTYVMTEKLASVRPSDLGGRIGSLGGDVMSRVARELAGLLAITPEDLGST